jgi:hypothetical protein
MITIQYTAGEIWEAIEDDIQAIEKAKGEAGGLETRGETILLAMKVLGKIDRLKLVTVDVFEAAVIEEARETGVVVVKGAPFSIQYGPPDFDPEIFPDAVAVYDKRGRLIASFETLKELSDFLGEKWPSVNTSRLLVQG